MLASHLSRFSRCTQSSLRCFSTICATVPPKLLTTIKDHSQLLDEYNDVHPYNRPATHNLEDLAALSVDFLQMQKHKGCPESSHFLTALQLQSFHHDYHALVLKGVPTQTTAAVYFSGIIGTMTGHKFWDDANIKSLKDMRIKHDKSELPFHTDFRNYGENLPDQITILVLSSDGKIKTNYVNTQQIYDSLTTLSQDILSQPIFMKKANPKLLNSHESTEPFSIFHRDRKNKLRLFFEPYDITFVDAPSTPHAQKAIEELTQIMKNPSKDIIHCVGLKTGEMLIFNNDPHNRSGQSCAARSTLISVLYDEAEYNFLPPIALTSVTASQLQTIQELAK